MVTSIGEVHFLATPLSRFPRLNRIAKQFRKWLVQFPCIYSHQTGFKHEWDYFLEGSSKNWDSDIYALPDGVSALQRGEYFIAHKDLSGDLGSILRKLELRGVQVITSNKPDHP